MLGLEPGKEIKLYKTPPSSVRIKRDPNATQAWWDDLPPEVVYLVEQRIGRLDRIGQIYDTVRIHNFYYDGTVEAKVYKKLRDRIDAFERTGCHECRARRRGRFVGKVRSNFRRAASWPALD